MSKQYTKAGHLRLHWCVAVLAVLAGCGSPDMESSNASGELASEKQALAAVTVPEAIAAGAYHSLALRKTGEVWGWGQNQHGQAGTGSTSPATVVSPTPVVGLPAAKSVAAGLGHSLALDLNGQVWAWGQNASGQAGVGSVGGVVPVPTRVSGLPLIQQLAAGGNYSLALDATGQVWAWGQNTSGQAGTGVASTAVLVPTKVAGLPAIQSIAAGVNHALALDLNGRVWGWGLNTSGQVGTGATSTAVLVPAMVTNLPPAKAVAAGAGHSLIIEAQYGNVWAWGQNNFGQVGNGTLSSTPVLAPTPVGSVFASTAIVAGHYFSLVIMGNGLARGWGQNTYGQLGNGDTANSPVRVVVTGLGDAKALAAGAQHALALRPGCPVWAWGNNGQGQLGIGTVSTMPVTTPTQSLMSNTFYFDGDGDGYGDAYLSEQGCTASPGFVEKVDCDDFSPGIHPDAPEVCNNVDDNCDTVVDNGNPGGNLACSTGSQGVCAAGTTACINGAVVCTQDKAASAEQCDGLDNDCDGAADDGNPGGMRACATGNLGVCASGVTYCTSGSLHCVQQVAASSEVCDGKDNDCNGVVDNGIPTRTWYRDADGDGYGNPNPALTTQNCLQPAGYVANASDCNDANAGIRPGAAEVCNEVDDDCDGAVDEGVKTTFYRDADGDTYGTNTTTQACSRPSGYATRSGDCNDANASIKPGATEVCDGKDNDCDGNIDEGVKKTFYRDADADTYGVTGTTTLACSQPSGYASRGSDCNDAARYIYPGAPEPCDTDYNCDGRVTYCPPPPPPPFEPGGSN